MMTRSDFIWSANHGPLLTAGYHYNPSVPGPHRGHVAQRNHALDHGYRPRDLWWHSCAPSGARVSFPSGLPAHDAAVCAPGAWFDN